MLLFSTHEKKYILGWSNQWKTKVQKNWKQKLIPCFFKNCWWTLSCAMDNVGRSKYKAWRSHWKHQNCFREFKMSCRTQGFKIHIVHYGPYYRQIGLYLSHFLLLWFFYHDRNWKLLKSQTMATLHFSFLGGILLFTTRLQTWIWRSHDKSKLVQTTLGMWRTDREALQKERYRTVENILIMIISFSSRLPTYYSIKDTTPPIPGNCTAPSLSNLDVRLRRVAIFK